jgi:predicted O-methyltransferase YrrM
MDNIIRHMHEIPHALEAFCGISLSDLLQTFPEAEKFQGLLAQDSVVNYMLAMVALTSQSSKHVHRSFGANLLTRCWMDETVRDKLYAVHGLTRHRLRDPEILVDHSRRIQLSNLTSQLQEVTSRPEVGNHLAEPASLARRLDDEIKRSDSLSVLKAIQASIPERSFHLFNHILYDIRTMIGDRPCTYLEIGSYCGASALLMLSHPLKTEVVCIDPLNLPSDHYAGNKSQEETLYDNLSRLGKSQDFEIIKSTSQDPCLVEALFRQGISIDILFIDGDHRFSSVVSDFLIYEPLVSPGGYIVFDDYHDPVHSPEVHHAVNELVAKNKDNPRLEIIGPIPDLQGCNPANPEGNEFVIHKRDLARCATSQ